MIRLLVIIASTLIGSAVGYYNEALLMGTFAGFIIGILLTFIGSDTVLVTSDMADFDFDPFD